MYDQNEIQPDLPASKLDAYLDGLMTAAQREAFERELADDELLRRECELQRRIDASLGRSFVAPAPPMHLLEGVASSVTSDETINELPSDRQDRDATKDKLKKRKTMLAVLAASIIWMVLGVKLYQDFFGEDPNDRYRQLALAEIYQASVESGFKPKWVCEDDKEFAGTFEERQGLPLLIKPDAQHLMVGLSYLEGLTAKTTTMLARYDDQPILVFVDRLDRDTRPKSPSAWSGLKLFRQELGELVLYEVTPLSEPQVMQHFYIPDASKLGEEIEE